MTAGAFDASSLASLKETFPSPAARRAEVLRRVGDDPSLLVLMDVQRWLGGEDDLRADLKPVRIAVLADCTVEGLLQPLRTFAQLRGLAVTIVSCPAYQVELQLLDPVSELATADADAVVMLLDVEKSLPSPFVTPSEDATRAFEDSVSRRLDALSAFAGKYGVSAFVADFVAVHQPLSPPYAHRADAGRWTWFQRANAWLAGAAASRHLEVLPLAAAFAAKGSDACVNLKKYLSTDELFSPTGFNTVAHLVTRQLAASVLARRKVLVVDLDNTLWGGVLGEDGPDGVSYRPDDYKGRVFHTVLQAIRALSETGVLLAIASKNDEAAALEMLSRDDFPLSPSDFAAHRINWKPKPENLVALADELQLGLDSFVFLDDSDAECVMMRQTLPQVTVVQVPGSLGDYPGLIGRIEGFDRPRLTDTDRTRKREYQNEKERRALAGTAPDFDAFLETLAIEIDLETVSESQLDRVVQLFDRTNQFNLSGVRYRRDELAPLVGDATRLVCAHYVDRFGQGGVVGALVLSRDEGIGVVDNFVLSCRVLGRRVEQAIVAAVAQRLAAAGVWALRFVCRETARNAPARAFLRTLTTDPEALVPVSGISAPARIRVTWRGGER